MKDKDQIYRNTEEVIYKAITRGWELGIKDFVIASCTGKTAEIFIEKFEDFKSENKNKKWFKDSLSNLDSNINLGINLVCVTHQVGFNQPNFDEMPQEIRQKLAGQGVKLLTSTHLFAGIDRALRFQFQGVYPSEIVATTLRMFGQGLKVCIEISVMAADAGFVKSNTDIIAVGGTGIGADTAIVINPFHSQHFFKSKVKEIICKPFEF